MIKFIISLFSKKKSAPRFGSYLMFDQETWLANGIYKNGDFERLQQGVTPFDYRYSRHERVLARPVFAYNKHENQKSS